MTRRLVISDGTNAKDATRYLVAQGGVLKPILRALVAQGGILRQYWPGFDDGSDPRITWDANTINVTESVLDPADSQATITFARATGLFTYDNYPAADVVAGFLSPALDGTGADNGKYLIRAVQVSGTALVGTLGTWLDLNADHNWYLPRTTIGADVAVATISIAQDNGAGAPVALTQIDKTVNFSSEVRSATGDIRWTTVQRDLVEIKETVDADCDLTFYPAGNAVGDADTSGAFNETWHVDYPSVSSPGSFTVKATLVSGTAPTGYALGSALTLDAQRSWKLLATTGEDLSCELDVEVTDGVTPVVKRVTMNSQRAAGPPTVTWTTYPWAIIDTGFDPGPRSEEHTSELQSH